MLHATRRRWLAASAALALTGCKREPEVPGMRVLAAASLTDVLPLVAADFTVAQPGPAPELVFDGSSRLATQITAGAPADVFISADLDWMDKLDADGLVVFETRAELLGNRLVAVVPKDSASAANDATQLAALGKLALAGESVPAGKYARAALTKLGVTDGLAANIVAADNVRTALSWVAKGEAAAGIVYATDAAIEPAVRVAFELPADSHPPIVYPIAVLTAAPQPARARAFVEFCRSEVASQRFRQAGFTVP